MSKREEPKVVRSRLTVLAFQLEGSDETVQEGLRKISQSVENAFRGNQRGATAAAQLKSKDQPAEASLEDAVLEDSSADAGDEQSADVAEANSPNAGTVSRKSKPEKIPDVVTIDKAKAKIPFDVFFAEKKQMEKSNQFLVAACWLKVQAGYQEFNVDHINTLMREIGQGMPDAPRKMLQNMKGRRNLSAGASKGFYTINSVGEGAVNRMPTS